MAGWRDQRGFTLAEAVAATAVLAIALTPLFSVFVNARWAAAQSADRTVALTVAREELSATINTGYAALTAGGLPSHTEYDSVTDPSYHVAVDVLDGPRAYVVEVRLAVSWTGMKQETKTIEVATLVEDRKDWADP